MSKDNIFTKLLKLGTESYTIFITVVVTIALHVLDNLHKSFFSTSALYIAISIILIQVLIIIYQLREQIEDSNKNVAAVQDKQRGIQETQDEMKKQLSYIINEQSCIVFPQDKSIIDRKVEQILRNKSTHYIKVICYGTSSYGKVIDTLTSKGNTIKSDVVFCSPSSSFINNVTDKALLEDFFEKLSSKDGINVYPSEIPPTIRASLMLDENKNPLLCVIQPYYMFKERPHYRGRDLTPILIASSENAFMLNELMIIFNDEFNRLKTLSKSTAPLVVTPNSTPPTEEGERNQPACTLSTP